MNNQTESSKSNDNSAYLVIGIISILILFFLTWLVYYKPQPSSTLGDWVVYLPFVNACFNTLTSAFLILGYFEVKKKNIEKHKQWMFGAVLSSVLFLVGYLIYHYYHGETKFVAQGPIRGIYFFTLASHIILSMFQLPLILITLYHAFRKNFFQHKKFARITFPIWLYVSVTGVLVFILLKMFNAA